VRSLNTQQSFQSLLPRVSLIKEVRLMMRHSPNQEASVEEQVPHLAARFRDEQASMASGPVGCPIAASTVGLMVCTHRVVRAD
jgi:hypothetical protein